MGEILRSAAAAQGTPPTTPYMSPPGCYVHSYFVRVRRQKGGPQRVEKCVVCLGRRIWGAEEVGWGLTIKTRPKDARKNVSRMFGEMSKRCQKGSQTECQESCHKECQRKQEKKPKRMPEDVPKKCQEMPERLSERLLGDTREKCQNKRRQECQNGRNRRYARKNVEVYARQNVLLTDRM